MNSTNTFQQIIDETKQTLRANRPGPDCPASDVLLKHVYQAALGESNDKITTHIKSCEMCQMVTLRMEADQCLWAQALEQNPESTLSQALGVAGRQKIRSQIRQTTARKRSNQTSFITKITESMVAWASPLWQPIYAGEAVTAAANVEEQSTRFEMDYGEYIDLRCHWRDDKDNQPSINLSWQANLLQPSKLWARFINPDNSTVLTEILLGSELEGTLAIPGSQLSFNPTLDKWAISIVVEED